MFGYTLPMALSAGAPRFGVAASLVALALVCMLFWRVRVRVAGQIDVFQLDAQISVTTSFVRVCLRTVGRSDGGKNVRLRMNVLRIFTVHTKFLRDEPEEKAPDDMAQDEGPRPCPGDEPGEDVSDDFTPVREAWARWRPAVQAAWAGALFMLGRVRLSEGRMRGEIGLGDASRTARAYGVAWMMTATGALLLQRRVQVEHPLRLQWQPAYNAWRLKVDVEGVWTMALRDVLVASIVAFHEFVRRSRTSSVEKDVSRRKKPSTGAAEGTMTS